MSLTVLHTEHFSFDTRLSLVGDLGEAPKTDLTSPTLKSFYKGYVGKCWLQTSPEFFRLCTDNYSNILSSLFVWQWYFYFVTGLTPDPDPHSRIDIQIGADEDDLPTSVEDKHDYISPVRMRNRRRFSEVCTHVSQCWLVVLQYFVFMLSEIFLTTSTSKIILSFIV